MSSDRSLNQNNQRKLSHRTVNSQVKTVNARSSRADASSSTQHSNKKSDSKIEKLPMLSSLAEARRQLREMNQSPSNEYYEYAPQSKSEQGNSIRSSRRESGILSNESQLSEEAREYFAGFKTPTAATLNEIQSSDSGLIAKALSANKTGLSKSSVFDEKPGRLLQQYERNALREKIQNQKNSLMGSSENTSSGLGTPLARILSRSEAYLDKNRAALEKDLNRIKVKEGSKEINRN